MIATCKSFSEININCICGLIHWIKNSSKISDIITKKMNYLWQTSVLRFMRTECGLRGFHRIRYVYVSPKRANLSSYNDVTKRVDIKRGLQNSVHH